MFITNEKRYIEENLINSDNVEITKPSNVINLLARYYINELDLSEESTYKKINEFMETHYFGYREANYYQIIDKYIKTARKFPLKKVDYVPITENEMNIIQGVGSKAEQRLLFTLVCIAKYNYLVKPESNGWVNTPDSEIFRMARLTSDLLTKEGYLGDMIDRGYLENSRSNSKTSVRVTFLDNESPIVLKVDDFRELGYEYKLYCGEKYIRCHNCNIPIRKTKHNKIYCKKCSIEIKKEKDRIRMLNSRKQNKI